MSKFKVGDKVRRILGLDGDATYGVVVETNPNSRIDVRLTAPAGPYAAGHIYLGNSSFWELLEEDDELPPVQDSVMYFNSVRDESNDQHLVVEMTNKHYGWNDEADAHIGLRVVPKTSWAGACMVGINLTPDAALQLAHDIRRMAMDIKRKEKANA